MKKYNYGSMSQNDPIQIPLGFKTFEGARCHADYMNLLRETWDDNPNGIWDKSYWKVKPEPWVVMDL